MPTNVTQKDQTLQEIIDYCEKMMNDMGNDLGIIEDHPELFGDYVICNVQGQVDAYENIALKCHHMLGKAVEDGD